MSQNKPVVSKKVSIPVYVYRACCNATAFVSRPLHALGKGIGYIYVNDKQYGNAMTFDTYGRFGPINIEVNKGDKVRVTLPSFEYGSILWDQARTSEYTITGNETQLVFVPLHLTNAQGTNASAAEIALERMAAIEPSPIGATIYERWPLDREGEVTGRPLGIVAQGPGLTGMFSGEVKSYLLGQVVYAVLPEGFVYMDGRPYFGISSTPDEYHLMEQTPIYFTDGTIIY